MKALVMLIICMVTCTQGQQCGVTNLPVFCDPDNDAPIIQYRQEVIIPSYRFTCCGVVTSWGAFVEPGGGNDEMVYTATFQVWKPIGDGNEYILVGENAYPDPIRLVDSSELRVNASEPTRIAFQPNDVVGYYLDSTRESDNRGVQLDTDNDDQAEVYYRQLTPNTTVNYFNTSDADNVKVERNGLPILQVGVEARNCSTINEVTTDTATRNQSDSQPIGSITSSVILGILLVAVSLAFLAYVVKNEIDKQRLKQTSSQSGTERTRVRRRSLYKLLLGIGRGKKPSSGPEVVASSSDQEHPPEKYSHLAADALKMNHRPPPPHAYSTLDTPESGGCSSNGKEESGKYCHLRENEKVKLVKLDKEPEGYSHLTTTPPQGTSCTNPTFLDSDEHDESPANLYTYIDVEPNRGARPLPPTEWRYEGVAPDIATLPATSLATGDQGPPTEWRYEGVAPDNLKQDSATTTPPTDNHVQEKNVSFEEVAI